MAELSARGRTARRFPTQPQLAGAAATIRCVASPHAFPRKRPRQNRLGLVSTVISTDEAIERARALASRGRRMLLGIAGPPGGGKSTLAQAVADELGDRARLVGMDGFHLAQAELVRLGRRDRMGALDTFDVGGYLALLKRMRDADGTWSRTRTPGCGC